MKEIKAVIAAYDKLDKQHSRAALATVVRVEGSSYRRTGARMLVADDGVWVGGISGGCLEGDALKRARLAIAKAEPSLVTYDTTDDDAYQIGVGLGCNGVIDVLFTPLNFGDESNPVEVLKSCIAQSRQTHVLVTVIGMTGSWPEIKTGDVIRYQGTNSFGFIDNHEATQSMQEQVALLISDGKSAPVHIELADGRKLRLFVETLSPEINMVLMGHQYDVYPMARLIKEIGWRVTIVSSLLKINPLLTGAVDAIFEYNRFDEIEIDKYTAVVLMAHDYKTDKANLLRALGSEAFYIGMLGPKVRAEKIFNELGLEGKLSGDSDNGRIFAPAGLDIGAVSPEEIALSIIGEIKAAYAKREGGFLRLRQSAIHERN